MMSSPAGAQLEWDGRHDVMKCAHIMSQALADPAELMNSYNASLHPDEHSRLAIELLTVSTRVLVYPFTAGMYSVIRFCEL